MAKSEVDERFNKGNYIMYIICFFYKKIIIKKDKISTPKRRPKPIKNSEEENKEFE